MHDDQQVVRLQQMDKSLKAGQFPVRWVSDLGFGYGYPVFNFYPPLAYYTGEVVHIFGPGYIDSIKIVWFLALVGSALSMYLLGRELFGKIPGLVVSMFYLYTPYHAVDAYVRGALAELFSFVWLPLILLASYKVFKVDKVNKVRWTVLTGVFLGLLMITHNLIFLPFAGIYVAWCLLLLIPNIIKSTNPKFYILSSVFYILFPLALAFGLTAFFWLPSLWEKQYTLVDQLLIKNLASYQIHFICPQQLWYSPWGFGGSVVGCNDGLSFALGKIYFVVIILGLGVSIFKKTRIGLISFLLLAFSLFMTQPFSKFVWDKLPVLWYLQFPWRFLEFSALFSAILAGAMLTLFKNQTMQIILAAVLIGGTMFFNAKYFVPQKLLTEATDATQTSDYQVKWVISETSFEYLPKGMATKITGLGTVGVDINEFQIARSEGARSHFKFQIAKGDFDKKSSRFLPDSFEMQGFSKNGGVIQFQIVNFPGWKVWINGKEGTIEDNNPYKLITVNVPAGDLKIEGKFTNTPARSVGNVISIIFIAGLLIYGIRRSKK